MHNLTELQQAFVVAYTSDPTAIGNCREAALRAGYSQHTAAESGRRLVTQPHIRDAIRAANLELISGRIATKAIGLLERVIDDESATHQNQGGRLQNRFGSRWLRSFASGARQTEWQAPE